MQQIRSTKIVKSTIIFLLAALIIGSFYKLFLFSVAHWNEPTLFADSYRFVEQGENPLSSWDTWILDQHNEHRIVFAKLATLIELNILNIPPGQSGIFQNFLLVFLSAGIWTLINNNFFKDKSLKIFTTLSGIALLIHPWQWQNLVWEFQTPWFFINVLVLLGTFVLSKPLKTSLSYIDIIIFLIPWFAAYSTGQGIAVCVALIISCFIKKIRYGILAFISSCTALFTYFYLLNYVKPGYHPDFTFNFKFFFALLFGGIWHGLFVLILISIICYSITRPVIPKDRIPTLIFPGIFSMAFTGMTTLSRSDFGLYMAASSRYTTHSLMLGLSAILLLGLIAEIKEDRGFHPIIGFSTLLITLGAFPQIHLFQNFRGDSFFKMWEKMDNFTYTNKEHFLCMADKNNFKEKNIDLTCDDAPHHKDLAPAYFRNDLKVKPIGWHYLQTSESRNNIKNNIQINYSVEEFYKNNEEIKIKGYIFATSLTRGKERFLIFANYGSNKKRLINLKKREDVKVYWKLKDKNTNYGFEEFLPLNIKGDLLESIEVVSRNSSEKIWVKNKIYNKRWQKLP